jgi:toxin FitB
VASSACLPVAAARTIAIGCFTEVLPVFGERILPFDVRAALQWGAFMGDGERAGMVPSNDDAKIAAVAAVHGLTVVTDNERDFAALGIPLVNPLR